MSILLCMDTGMPPAIDSSVNNSSKSFLFYFLFAFFCIGTVVLGYFVFFGARANTVIEKVGEERIYQNDLNYEVSQLPPQAKINKKQILEKMADDSIILQAAAKMHLITLQNSFFNDPHKNYPLRIQMVRTVTNKVKEQATHVIGTAFWLFFQNGLVGPLGYEKSKEITLKKISDIHQNLLTRRFTIAQATAQIQNDTSLKEIDPSYKTNAAYDFDLEKGQAPTRIKPLNDLVWQLPENAVTDIYTDQGRNINDTNIPPSDRESYYAFIVITKRVVNKDITEYNTWLAAQKKAYEVISY